MGRPSLSRDRRGRDDTRLMSEPPTSVPSGPSDNARHIMLGTDLGEASDAAESMAIDMAARLRAELLVVNVIDPRGLRLPGGRFLARLDQVRVQRRDGVARIVARAREVGVIARFLVWEGEPGERLLDAAEAEDADLIIVGSHRRNRLGRLLLGSVSTRVVEHARRPVIVARGDETVRYEPTAAAAEAGRTAP
jgi:nucleotide-binding universal stress UspA family protein